MMMMMGKIKPPNCCANLMLVMVIWCWCACNYPITARTITDSSPLDNLIIRPLFHKFRNFTFGIVGPTSLLKRSGKFYQSPLRRFPCDTTAGRSSEPPTSVHKLRPGRWCYLMRIMLFSFDRGEVDLSLGHWATFTFFKPR